MAVERKGGLVPRKGMALGALVLSIASFVLFCIGPLLSIPAIILGFSARAKANRDPQEYGGKGMALAGAVVGIINVVLTPVIWLVALPFMMAALVIVAPGVNKARERKMQLSDQSQIRQIMNSVIRYADENKGEFPPHLAAVADKLGNPNLLVSQRSNTKPLAAFPSGKPWADFSADVDGHCDFAYIGAGMKMPEIKDPADTIIVFTKTLPGDPGRSVGFADGHTQWMNMTDLGFALSRTNETRKRIGLGAVTLDSLMPPAPVTIGPPPSEAERLAMRPAQPRLADAPPPRVGPPTPPPRLTQPPQLPPVEPGPPATRRIVPRPRPVPIPVPDETLVTVKSVDQALTAMRTGNAATKRSALYYLERNGPVADEANRKEIAGELEKCLKEPHLRRTALGALRKWSVKENGPALAKLLGEMEPERERHFAEINILLEALGNTGDPQGAEAAAKMLEHGFNRMATSKALVAMGPEAEPAVIPYLADKNTMTVRAAVQVLEKIGTSKSVGDLEKLLADRNPFMRADVERAIKAIKQREAK